ncbi:sulfite exporter TauE/SafE family protein [Stieleria sp. JC731]|uniref:urease accessory protein UreH domain-containing protein n=1 Tax=Pirellulaceae TaxID=2691357 RepID=UPI001E583755|nr:sulfite exporter TauE/SafE family protein [Stieleria sp. JC731]MCC9602610.1 sulfite exporter TauE/SafE family protein [Stieleria sp. JC731]
MDSEVSLLVGTAFSVGMLHTLMGPDHYVPFVAMSRSQGWSMRKTIAITAVCGIGHVLGSVVIGSLGLLLGTAVFHLESLESFRGDGASWLLIGFGLAYLTWAIAQRVRGISHHHEHIDDTVHGPSGDHHHHSVTPWVLFLIFVFGPCEVLIPLLMYPAAEANVSAILMVVAAFTVATLGTMLVSVLGLTYGLKFIRMPKMHEYGHTAAALAVLGCGTLMKVGL